MFHVKHQHTGATLDTKPKTINPAVLNEVLDAVEKMLAEIDTILADDDDTEYYHNVCRAISNFVGKCEGSYYHNGTDGFYARLGN